MRIRRKKIAFNQKLVLDSIVAGIVVSLAPDLLNRYLFQSNPISGMTGTAAGVGVNYLLAQYMGRPDMANAGIGFGLVQFVKPIVDQVIGIGSPVQMLPAGATAQAMPMVDVQSAIYNGMADYGRLNEYISEPRKMHYSNYQDSY